MSNTTELLEEELHTASTQEGHHPQEYHHQVGHHPQESHHTKQGHYPQEGQYPKEGQHQEGHYVLAHIGSLIML